MRDKSRRLSDDIERTRRRIEQRPVLFSSKSAATFLIVIDQGNELETGQDGIVYYEGELPSVPSAYDPDVTTSFTDGIGRGTLYKNGVAQDGYVLVVNDDRGSFRNALFQGDPIRTSGAVSIPVSGGGTVRAYTAGT